MNPYWNENLRLRSIHLRSLTATSPAAIVERTGCTMRDAFRLVLVREIASVVLIDAWVREKVGFRKILRLAIDFPDDQHAQLSAFKPRKPFQKTKNVSLETNAESLDESPPTGT